MQIFFQKLKTIENQFNTPKSSESSKNYTLILLPKDELIAKIGSLEKKLQEIAENINEDELVQAIEGNNHYWLMAIKPEASIGQLIASIIRGKSCKSMNVIYNTTSEQCSKNIVSELLSNSYVFDKYKKFSEKEIIDENLKLYIDTQHMLNTEEIDKLVKEFEIISWVKDSINTAPNDLYPYAFAQKINSFATQFGITVTILSEEALAGMNLLIGVGKGSINKPYVVILEWTPENCKEKSIALVGKGVTYDSGGLSLKPSQYMETMKSDMSGAAAVVGAIMNAANLNIQRKIIGIVGLVENMPAGNALKPDDVLISLSGKTVEINNTDAEGRLVLADIMTYVQEKFSPEIMIDLATLTGAMSYALGSEFAGLFSNDEELSDELIKAGLKVKEELWRLPLHKSFSKATDSKIADMKNCSSTAKAGSSIAAAFLQKFVLPGVKWAHFDIANVAFLNEYGTGFGVRLITEFLQNGKYFG